MGLICRFNSMCISFGSFWFASFELLPYLVLQTELALGSCSSMHICLDNTDQYTKEASTT
jgi:hypothetical protein